MSNALRALWTTVALASSGCLFGEVSGIPCENDGGCPSAYFCDLPRSECRQVSDTFGPPLLTVTQVTDPSGAQVTTPFVPPDVTSTIVLLPENVGGSPAENVRLTFANLACISFDVDEATQPPVIDAGATGGILFDVTPGDGCEGLTIIDWFLSYSGRETRGIFDMNVKAQD